MKATARVYAFSALFCCVGIFAGAIAQRLLDERQFFADSIQREEIAKADKRCDTADEAKRFIEAWQTAAETCVFLSSQEAR